MLVLLRLFCRKPSIGEPFEGREFDVGQLRQVKFDNNRVLGIAGAGTILPAITPVPGRRCCRQGGGGSDDCGAAAAMRRLVIATVIAQCPGAAGSPQ
jgi:hypothetical protein